MTEVDGLVVGGNGVTDVIERIHDGHQRLVKREREPASQCGADKRSSIIKHKHYICAVSFVALF